VVGVLSMASAPRSDEALSAGANPLAARRWLLVVVAVIVPIALGALATVVLYATRAKPAVPRPTLVSASDVKGLDGSVLVVQPNTTAQVKIALGSTIEIVLSSYPGETVVSQDTLRLSPVPNPACHATALCGFPGAQRYTFQAIQGGVGYLEIVYGFHVCYSNGECTTTPYVYKPIAVYTRPQRS
jgi:hypothetical protein